MAQYSMKRGSPAHSWKRGGEVVKDSRKREMDRSKKVRGGQILKKGGQRRDECNGAKKTLSFVNLCFSVYVWKWVSKKEREQRECECECEWVAIDGGVNRRLTTEGWKTLREALWCVRRVNKATSTGMLDPVFPSPALFFTSFSLTCSAGLSCQRSPACTMSRFLFKRIILLITTWVSFLQFYLFCLQ